MDLIATTTLAINAVKSLDYLENLENLSKSWLERPEISVSLISSLVALAIAVGIGGWLREKFFVIIKVPGIQYHIQYPLEYWRLAIINEGIAVAKDLQSEITEIIDDKEKRNILPLPLNWSNIDGISRDILPKQTAYLDVVRHDGINKTGYVLAVARGGWVKEYTELKPGITKAIKITIFQRSGNREIKNIKISWDNGIPKFSD